MRTSAFAGFGTDLVPFFGGLAGDNTTTYWRRHVGVYEAHVRGPMRALAAELSPEFGPVRIFRPHRDQRFSRDGAAYKTYCAAVVGSYYCQVSAAGLLVGEGVDGTSPAIAERFRRAVDEERAGTELGRLFTELTAHGWVLQGNQVKTAPRGYSREHPRIELLRYRSVWATRQWPPDDTLYSPRCLDRVRDAFRALTPFYRWLSSNVFLGGPTSRR